MITTKQSLVHTSWKYIKCIFILFVKSRGFFIKYSFLQCGNNIVHFLSYDCGIWLLNKMSCIEFPKYSLRSDTGFMPFRYVIRVFTNTYTNNFPFYYFPNLTIKCYKTCIMLTSRSYVIRLRFIVRVCYLLLTLHDAHSFDHLDFGIVASLLTGYFILFYFILF